MRIGRRKRNRQRGRGNRVCERDKQVYFDSRGSPTATAHLSSSPFSRSRNSQRASEALQTLSFRQRIFSAVDASVYEDSRRKFFPLERSSNLIVFNGVCNFTRIWKLLFRHESER